MKHTILISLVLYLFISCGDSDKKYTSTLNPTTDPGVIINGIKWATRNVDEPGTFAAMPESYGMFYQWNRKVGWSSTILMLNSNGSSEWDNTDPVGTQWTKENDPSPAGWRVPTLEELESLLDAEKVSGQWISQKGIMGRKFTDKVNGNSIFLPAAGARIRVDYLDGAGPVDEFKYTGSQGNYWSSEYDVNWDPAAAYLFYFNNSSAACRSLVRFLGFSVRPVAE